VEDARDVLLSEDDSCLLLPDVPLDPGFWLGDNAPSNRVDAPAEIASISHRGKRGLAGEDLRTVRQILTNDPKLDSTIEIAVTR